MPLEPITREENFLARIAGDGGKELEPITRTEHFLQRIIEAGGGGEVTAEAVVDATGAMTAEQQAQTRRNIGAGEPLTPEQIAAGAGAWLENNLSTPSTPPIDSTLSVANAAADAKATGDAVGELKSAMQPLYEVVNASLVDNSYWIISGVNAGAPSAYNGWSRTARIPCTPGEALLITATVASEYNLFFSSNADRTMVSSFELQLGENTVTVPNGAYYFGLSNTTSAMENTVIKKIITSDQIKEIKNEVDGFSDVIIYPNLSDPDEYTIGKYWPPDSSAKTNATYDYTGQIFVQPGETIYTTTTARYLKALDMSGSNVAASGLSSDFTSYTVPSGIYSVYISFYHADINSFMVTKYRNASYTPYGSKIISREYIPNFYPKSKYIKIKGDLDTNNKLLIDKLISVKKNVLISFSGNISDTFTGLEIGFTSDESSTDETHFKVTPTKVQRVTSSPTENEHGLTISNNLAVNIEIAYNNTLKITVTSNGESYTMSSSWAVQSKKIYAKALNDMTDCVLSWTCSDNNCEIAIFGDSYCSYGSDRWTYYLIEPGYIDNVLINAYPGETTENGFTNFESIFQCINPKFVVWALGMNNGDTSSAANATWMDRTSKMINICLANGIKPILCTIPNVETVNNAYKNTYVRNSGFDYIDFAAAVGSDESTSWYAGMLSEDGVHPSEIGAVALYNRAIADFPELTIRS